MQIHTFHADTVRDFIQSIDRQISGDFRPDAAIVFASVDFNLEEITAKFHQEKIRVFGCSSCGEFLYDKNVQNITEGSSVCMLMETRAGTTEIKLFEGTGMSSFALGEQVGTWACNTYHKPAILVLASGLDTDGEQLVRGIQSTAGKETTIFGGLAGDDARFQQTYVFSENCIESKGAIVMIYDTAFYAIGGIATSGWVGIGADKVITRSEGNVVYTIDNQPALDVYKDYLNVNDDDLPEIGVEYPLLVKRAGADDVLRAVINVDKEQKSLIFAGTVPQGSNVTFSSSPGFEIIDFTRKKVDEFFGTNRDSDFLVLFSCMARHNALGPTISEEIDAAWNTWQKPLIGFFTYGEIGNNFQSACEFHNETFTMVSIQQLP